MRKIAFLLCGFIVIAGHESVSSANDDCGRPALFISNSRGDNVVRFDQVTGQFDKEFIGPGSGGLHAPDAMAFGPDGDFYVSSGDDASSSAILRYDGRTGEPKGAFATGGGLIRPYGLAFGPDNKLYVSSFLSDRVLRYHARTGRFLDVFAAGNAKPGGLNGPNGIAFGPDGKLYVSTEGTVAVDGKPTYPGLPSQVLRFDISTRVSSVFVDQPEPSPAGHGFVSLLGLAFGPDCRRGDCDLFVSDFANDIRRYDAVTGELEQVLSTSYSGIPSTNFLGGLVFGQRKRLFTVGFDSPDGSGHRGTVLRFDGVTGSPLPSPGKPGAVFVSADARMVRPIGIVASPTANP